MNPEEALEAFDMLGGKNMIPMHYGTFPLGGEPLHEPAERLLRASSVERFQNKVHILEDGGSLLFNKS